MASSGMPSIDKQILCNEAATEWNSVKKEEIEEIEKKIREYLTTPAQLRGCVTVSTTSMQPSPSPFNQSFQQPCKQQLQSSSTFEPIHHNATAQKQAFNAIKRLQKELEELNTMNLITTNIQLHNDLSSWITAVRNEMKKEEERLKKLKRHAHNQQKSEIKKLRALKDDNVVVSLAARAHHHPTFVGIAGVSRDERSNYVDKHYCLASVKNARQFAAAFEDFSVVLSQDDKAKVPVGIPAVGKHFRTMQTIREPVSIADYDFLIGSFQKLTPSVYLAINPNELNEALQLSIFIRVQWHISSTSISYIADILSLVDNEDFSTIFKRDKEVKPLWVILVDGGPNENSCYLKNINQYCKLFCYLDLDYMTIRTHASGQSSYNPVERSMVMLSGKLAEVTLKINHFEEHLNSQGEVCDYELDLLNFHYAGKVLANLWKKDPIHGKPVYVEYVDKEKNLFVNVKFLSELETTEMQNAMEDDMPVPWLWVETYCQICRYSLDIKKCNDLSCCTPKRADEAVAFLGENNGFLPPVTKGKDGHYLNSIHMLQYFSNLKILAYDEHLPSLSAENHSRQCCKKYGKYFPTTTMLVRHKKTIHPNLKNWCQGQQFQTNLATLDDFSLLPSYFEMWPRVVVESQSFSDIE
ncbi:2022_t:CDS:2 [Cetraspora pellucida]|uniref:2022_t:CDS:1 n=1 Tax=Cetraspora pellucida TaxID=1433469 RepID=A0A9N9HY07_9GLOM|nr:2022_t:CDS:2 [Cetraspora pellucida]